MIYMFNELSIQQLGTKQAALDVLENFVKATVKAAQAGINELRLYEGSINSLYQLDLYEGYKVDNWLKDPDVDADIKDRFREILTSSPLITKMEVELSEIYSWSIFYKILDKVQNRVYGLGAAYLFSTLAISLSTHEEWKKTEISIVHHHVNEGGEELSVDVIVKNFCGAKDFEHHLLWWADLQKKSLNTSAELWERREEFFKNLIFCNEVEKQVQKIGVSKMLSQIIDRLRTLNEYAGSWKEGSFSYEDVNSKTNLRISPESFNTIRMFSAQRKFTIPNQGKKLFDLHIKTGDLRFHFYPDNENKKIYIGYIGKHLRISSEG